METQEPTIKAHLIPLHASVLYNYSYTMKEVERI